MKSADTDYEKERYGFISNQFCTDCGMTLIPLRKEHGDTVGIITAKVCINRACFHFVDTNKLDTWRNSIGFRFLQKDWMPLPEFGTTFLWVYKKNDHMAGPGRGYTFFCF